MSNVVEMDAPTRLRTPVPTVLARAAGAGLEDVVAIGWKQDGTLYFASSESDGAEVLWLLEKARLELMKGSFEP